MASTNKTKNIELNQWVGTDPVRREDFNADNEKIDAAFAAVNDTLATELEQFRSGLMKIAQGSYVGSGNNGSNYPNRINFDFDPYLVIITYNNMRAMFIKGQTYACAFKAPSTSQGQALSWYIDYVTWGNKSLSWYIINNAETQLNMQNITYNYIAIGM